jgi:NADH-quinone oxidoreductase subunit C
MSHQVVAALTARFADAIVATHDRCGDDTVILKREALLAVLRFLKDEPALAFDMPIDVCGVDYQAYQPARPHAERFEVVYHLRSTTKNHRVRLRVPVPEADPVVDSGVGVWKGVSWFERETFDMFGIRFQGHPDLRRVLLYDEFEGHPLRKDYPVRGYQPRLDMPNLHGDELPWRQKPDEEA